jgi:ComF family protein
LAAVRRAALDLEALLVPVACLGCGRSLAAAEAPSCCCAGCRNGMRRIAPPRCRRCGQTLDRWEMGRGAAWPSTCGLCHSWPAALSWAASAVWLDEGPARALVHALKYDGWRCAAGPMAELVARECGERLSAVDALVPVPLGRRRRRERGHNQADVLARAMGERCGIRVAEGALARARETRSQTALAPEERRANVAGAFVAIASLEGRRVALVDDVLTTGATLAAAAEALTAAGAIVGGVTFARATKPE